MNKIRNYWKNKKGITIVWGAFFLVLCVMFLGLAADIAYMYVVKNQLQVAADASALAGAAGLPDTIRARQQAWRFACKNKAGTGTESAENPEARVYLATNDPLSCDASLDGIDLNNTNDPNGDVVLGNWNRNRPQEPQDLRFCAYNDTCWDASTMIINAVKARPRRTGETPGMPKASLFIGKVFGWSLMDARASAIAARPPRMNLSVSICSRSCTDITPAPSPTNPVTLYWSPYPSEVDPGTHGIAWTILSETTQATPTNELAEFFCGTTRDACNLTVYSSNGYNNASARQFRCAFTNPLYDSDFKTCADGNCDNESDTVTSWTVIVPVFDATSDPDACPPGNQPRPYTITQYAEVTISRVWSSGAGGGNYCACDAFPASNDNGPNAIQVTGIQCHECPSNLLGRKAVLVK